MTLSATHRQSTDLEARPASEDALLERFQAIGVGLFRYLVVRLDGDAAQADDLMQQVWLVWQRWICSS